MLLGVSVPSVLEIAVLVQVNKLVPSTTLTEHVADSPSLVAVIVALPAVTPVTNPSTTVAFSLLDVQFVEDVTSSPFKVAVNYSVSPSIIEIEVLFKAKPLVVVEVVNDNELS